ncbi:MAG: Pyruvate carboxylase subunit A [Candidatus Heimdallarchaeota archaeon LC_3]|nr:MAG: Pyruvate carboxylase subunit A [Candidatus Heimdallarchaeota archaeon LC_3]
MFDKILIANRGEISIRISQAAQEMGIKTVAVFSDPDELSPHVFAANESYSLGGETPQESYLDINKIIKAAKATGAHAIHPGYGFLSERADFAEKCWKENIVFIGPHPEAIKKMGDKIEAKKIMKKCGVPVIPGYIGSMKNKKILRTKAEDIGYPIIIKAAAGGGGKGMRIVKNSEELIPLLESAAREAKNAFGDNRVFIEKFVNSPRHIEIQVLGDNFENIIHLHERECSIQRRYQKIVEETPSLAVNDDLRTRMGEAAIKAAKAVNYNSAGTVEFILDDTTKEFYFLEMNTRLQVEHPITELVMGCDIVQWMIKIASGLPLVVKQSQVKQRGHAIECRIYAENPHDLEFRPSIGKIIKYELNSRIGVRNDTGIQTGSEISINYDPMLSKLIVYSETREEAIQKMKWALSNYVILGVETNIEFLNDIFAHESFINGKYNTNFIPEYFKGWRSAKVKEEVPKEVIIANALYDMLQPQSVTASRLLSLKNSATQIVNSYKEYVARWGRQNLESTSIVFGLNQQIDLKSEDKKKK